MNNEVTLPSGAILKITLAPFKDARNLYQAILEEAKVLKLDPNAEVDVNLYKDLFCLGLSSKKIEAALWECMKRATYNGNRIAEDVFEPIEARDDYMAVCFEVAKANILPFTKSLYAQYAHILEKLQKGPA